MARWSRTLSLMGLPTEPLASGTMTSISRVQGVGAGRRPGDGPGAERRIRRTVDGPPSQRSGCRRAQGPDSAACAAAGSRDVRVGRLATIASEIRWHAAAARRTPAVAALRTGLAFAAASAASAASADSRGIRIGGSIDRRASRAGRTGPRGRRGAATAKGAAPWSAPCAADDGHVDRVHRRRCRRRLRGGSARQPIGSSADAEHHPAGDGEREPLSERLAGAVRFTIPEPIRGALALSVAVVFIDSLVRAFGSAVRAGHGDADRPHRGGRRDPDRDRQTLRRDGEGARRGQRHRGPEPPRDRSEADHPPESLSHRSFAAHVGRRAT